MPGFNSNCFSHCNCLFSLGKSSVEKFAFDVTSRAVNVGEDVGNCEAFNILGYSIEGRVLTSDSEPQEGVSLELFGKHASLNSKSLDS